MSIEDQVKTMLIAIVLLSVIGIVFASAQPYFEAKAFNRLTGANVSVLEAMFVELRVDCNNVKKERLNKND